MDKFLERHKESLLFIVALIARAVRKEKDIEIEKEKVQLYLQ